MDKDKIIELLSASISSDSQVLDKEKLEEANKLLVDIKNNVTKLKDLDFERIKAYCQVAEEEIQELSFYMIMCELQDTDYRLTEVQIQRISELINKYLNEVSEIIILIDKNQKNDNYLRQIIEKINQDRFELSSEELRNINRILKDKQVDISQVNQVLINLSLMTIRELERQISKRQDGSSRMNHEEKIIKDAQPEVKLEKGNDKGSNSQLSKNILFDKLLAGMKFYNRKTFNDEFMKQQFEVFLETTTLEKMNDILLALQELKIKLKLRGNSDLLRIRQLLSYSSGKIIRDVIIMASEALGMDNQDCFDYLVEHIAIFVQEGIVTGYQNFIDNMRLFNSLGLSKDLFMVIPVGIFCEDAKKIKKNVLIMEKYKIPREKYLSSMTILKTSKNCSEDLDTWIELGTTESKMYLEGNLSILVNSQIKNLSDKLRILRDLHINITVKDTYKTLNKKLFKELDLIGNERVGYLNGVLFEITFIPYIVVNQEYDPLMNKKEIDLLDDKASKSEIYQKFINSLDCIDNLYYNIPGVNIRISKNKVYRVFNNLINNGMSESREMLIYALTYKSSITEEEYNNVCLYVDQLLGNNLSHKGSVR